MTAFKQVVYKRIQLVWKFAFMQWNKHNKVLHGITNAANHTNLMQEADLRITTAYKKDWHKACYTDQNLFDLPLISQLHQSLLNKQKMLALLDMPHMNTQKK